MKLYSRSLFFFLVVWSLIGCSAQQTLDQQAEGSAVQQIGLSEEDPWEGYNRKVFSFNEWVDTYVARPLAVGYNTVLPNFAQSGVRHFFSNLGEVYSIVNNLLQLDGEGAGTSFMRFAVNSTLGFFGFFDIATEIGMRQDQEDFGQTLGYWGVGAGNYLVLPFVGPSNTRDVFSYADYLYYNQYNLVTKSPEGRLALTTLDLVQIRAGLLDLEDQMAGDKYSFIRDVYLQRRKFLVTDGEVTEDTFFAEGKDEVSDDDF